MKYRSGSHFRDAIEEHVRALSRDSQSTPERLRKEIAFDRLLARLLQVAPDRWVLKGGLALDHRLGDRARTTKDMDLGPRDDIDAATSDLQRAAALDLGDYFSFAIRLTNELPDLFEEGVAARYHAAVSLADASSSQWSSMLASTRRSSRSRHRPRSPRVRRHPAVQSDPAATIARRREGARLYSCLWGWPEVSTRVKDLIDLVLIATSSSLQAEDLADALAKTFTDRATHAPPRAFPKPPDDYWPKAYAKMAARVGLDPTLGAGHALAAVFLDPVLSGTCARCWSGSPARRVGCADVARSGIDDIRERGWRRSAWLTPIPVQELCNIISVRRGRGRHGGPQITGNSSDRSVVWPWDSC